MTICAMKVTAEHSKAHGKRPRQSVKEWLLLYWVELKRADISVWNVQLAAAIESHATDAIETIEDHASMTARVAPEAIVLEVFIEFAFFGIGLQDILECR